METETILKIIQEVLWDAFEGACRSGSPDELGAVNGIRDELAERLGVRFEAQPRKS